MGRAELFEHTADLGLRVAAADLDDLFRTAAEGLFGCIVANLDEVRDAGAETVTLAADSVEDLLLAWLGELIFRVETRHRLDRRFDVRVAPDGRSLQAELGGEPIDPDRHLLDHEVKAVTRHGLVVERVGDGWKAELILDI